METITPTVITSNTKDFDPSIRLTRDEELAILATNPKPLFSELEEPIDATQDSQLILFSEYVMPAKLLSSFGVDIEKFFTIPIMTFYRNHGINQVRWYLTALDKKDNKQFLQEARANGCKLTPKQRAFLELTRDEELAILAINPEATFPELEEPIDATPGYQLILFSQYVIPSKMLQSDSLDCEDFFTIPVMKYYRNHTSINQVRWYLSPIDKKDNKQFLQEARANGCKLTPKQREFLEE